MEKIAVRIAGIMALMAIGYFGVAGELESFAALIIAKIVGLAALWGVKRQAEALQGDWHEFLHSIEEDTTDIDPCQGR